MIQDELDTLAERVTQLARMIQDLRTENQTLRACAKAQDAELASLHARLDAAASRLDSLMNHLGEPLSPTQP